MPVSSQGSERTCICVLGVSIVPLSMGMVMDFETVQTLRLISLQTMTNLSIEFKVFTPK
jgi:hypothetical protein